MVGPSRNTCTSAVGVTLVVTCDPPLEPLLLFVFESGVSDVLDARLTNDPLPGAVTATVNAADAPLAKIIPGHTTTLLLKMKPPEALWNTAPAGSVSRTTTFDAVEGPLLVAVIT